MAPMKATKVMKAMREKLTVAQLRRLFSELENLLGEITDELGVCTNIIDKFSREVENLIDGMYKLDKIVLNFQRAVNAKRSPMKAKVKRIPMKAMKAMKRAS